MSHTDPVISNWLRRQAALFRLLGESQSRRDRLALLIVNIRSLTGLPLLAALALLLPASAWYAVQFGSTPLAAWEVLCPLFAAVAILLGAVIYAPEQRSGTFELLWLACGSGGALLRLKISALLIVFLILAVPVTLITFSLLPGGLNRGEGFRALFFLLTNAWFLFASMAWIGTRFSQAWSAGLLGAAFFVVLYLTLGGVNTSLNLFLNPISPEASPLLTMNRLLVIVGGVLLMRSAARRLRQAF
ncbi:MAG: hypothetical protein JJU11_01145 [Candidatus Sumerlaeia bacterium]|nr:hypothetical protein [Candidatus Sumerlaeia bacterium]